MFRAPFAIAKYTIGQTVWRKAESSCEARAPLLFHKQADGTLDLLYPATALAVPTKILTPYSLSWKQLNMANQGLPLMSIVLTGAFAVLAYSLIRIFQERRQYRNLV